MSEQKATCPMGRSFDPQSSAYVADPYKVFARAHEEAPVFFSEELDSWVVTRYDDVVSVLMDNDRFSAANALGNPPRGEPEPEVIEAFQEGFSSLFAGSMVMRDPPDHKRLRRLVDRAFVPRRVAAMEPDIRRIADELIDGMLLNDGHEADFAQAFALPMPLRVIFGIIGVPREDFDEVRGFSTAFAKLLFDNGAPLEQRVEAARQYVGFERYAAERIRERQKNPRDDLLTAIVTDNDLELRELVSLVVQLFVAGHETTAGLLANTIHLLLADRRRWEELRRNPELAPQVVEEALRAESPVQCHYRRAREAVSLDGMEIPEGASLSLFFGAANRDEEVFPEPEGFDPRRANAKRNLSFGRGIHFCVGAGLARLEGKIALEQLVSRLPDLRLSETEEPVRVPMYFARQWARLPVAY